MRNLFNNDGNAALVFLIVVGVIALIIFGPIFTIWSLNFLFGTSIAVSFKAWLAVIWLASVIGGTKYKSS